MKRTLSAIAATFIVLASFNLPSPVFAAAAAITGSVKLIKVHAQGVGGNFFVLNTGTPIGRCNMTEGGVMFIIPDNDRGKQMLSLVQSAMLSGKQIEAHADDKGATSNVFCDAVFVVLRP